MLILTDRMNDSLAVHDYLAKLGRCQIVDVRQAQSRPTERQIVVCDIDLANPASVKLTAATLSNSNVDDDIPVLVLKRGSGPLADASPASLRATEVIHSGAPPALIISVVKRLIDDHQSKRAAAAKPIDAKESALGAASVFSRCLNAFRRREAVSVVEIERGATLVLSAVKQTQIGPWLDVVRRFDDITYQHCLLVSGLVASLSAKIGLTSKHQRMLTQAALIHDVGKACLSPSILNKPSALSQAETEIMQSHAVLGYDMLAKQNNISPAILDVVRHHLELIDGTGYPDGLKGSEISGNVRIVTICDIYAALIERRPYKAPMRSEQALAVLSDMGGKLDRELVKYFESAVAGTK